ncbi:Transcription factor MTB3 [Camellia lanceoleosa]|uniref:Transcription factor MTB3 n=1 Tax=Camellia lanceoleosa TaxID=1840588 RepID=A0ACC0FQP3_9ERIC|nr:Transcription factor MTB3 [Camellia lanceoleosa]
MVKTTLGDLCLQAKVVPKIFGHERSLGGAKSRPKVEDDSRFTSNLKICKRWELIKFMGTLLIVLEVMMMRGNQEREEKARQWKRGTVESCGSERQKRKKQPTFLCIKAVVPNIFKMDKASLLGDAITYISDLEKKIRVLETEKYTGNNKQKQCIVPEIDFQARHEDAVVRVRCPLDAHPVSRVIKTFREHQVIAQESKVSTTNNGEIVHSFSILTQDGLPRI